MERLWPRDRIVAVAGVGLVVTEADEGKKEEVGEGVGVGEEDEGKKEEEVEEEEEDDDGLKGARAVEGAMKKRKRAITDTSASVKAAKRVRMRHDILCGVCNKRVKIQSFPRHKLLKQRMRVRMRTAQRRIQGRTALRHM